MEEQPQLKERPEVADEGKSKPPRRQNKLRRMSPWKLVAIICSLLVVVLITMVGIFMAVMLKNPAFQVAMKNYQVMITCESQMAEIGGALDRYVTSHDRYPESLEDLYPDYLAAPRALHCPADKAKAAAGLSNYFYAPPKEGAPEDTSVVVCRRHRVFSSQPPFIVQLLKNGDVAHVPVVETSGRSRSGVGDRKGGK